MNNKNCCLCKYYKDGYCENLELHPQYPSTGCDYFENKDNCKDCIEIPVSLVKNMCKALSDYEHSDVDCFSEIHDACVDIDAFCRDKLNDPSSSEKIISKNLCDSCINSGCIFQSGIVRNHCDFYKSRSLLHDLEPSVLIKTNVLDEIRDEIEQTVSRYSISRERGCMGKVEWSDRLIKESEVLQIIDKYKASPTGEELGKWIDRSIPGMAQFMCSQCEGRSFFKANYCPNCGKKMEMEE